MGLLRYVEPAESRIATENVNTGFNPSGLLRHAAWVTAHEHMRASSPAHNSFVVLCYTEWAAVAIQICKFAGPRTVRSNPPCPAREGVWLH